MVRVIFSFVFSFLMFLPASLFSQEEPHIIVLGTAQDGGYPHMGCTKECCKMAWKDPSMRRYVVSLALVDPISQQWYLFEATPDIKEQLHLFRQLTSGKYDYLPRAVFVSHAHIGHYPGLMQFGREVMNTRGLTVYTMPRMKKFLESNGPWDQLVRLQNIVPVEISNGSELALSGEITIKCFPVPHRDEYSETAAYEINTLTKKYLFIPDIDKWCKWNENIADKVKTCDIAFVDGTFYSEGELGGRNMEEIPHPFIVETIELFTNEDKQTTEKIHFIHLNHSNPALFDDAVKRSIINKGFSLAEQARRY
ncbi:MAG: hypothetical protein K9J25_10530 [Bacteroidales bacterium]|nr:hypothetical protein [Bacteroidales bacterium]